MTYDDGRQYAATLVSAMRDEGDPSALGEIVCALAGHPDKSELLAGLLYEIAVMAIG